MQSDNRDGKKQAIPFIFSYVILRPESFGALLYNPVMGIDITLDREESRIAFLCDGSRSMEEIIAYMEKRGGLKPAASGDITVDTIKKLSGMGALGFRPEKRPEQRRPRLYRGPLELSAPKRVTWEITSECNLRCPHCFTSASTGVGDLSKAQARQVVGQLARARVFYVLLSGGEAMLRPDVFDILRGLSAARIRTDIGTNGLDVAPKAIKKLKEAGVRHTHVSVDGIGEPHDIFRGRKGAFEAACGTIQKLLDAGLGASISTTATAVNVRDLGRIIDLAVDLRCTGFNAIPFFPVGRGKASNDRYKLSREDLYIYYRTINDKRKEYKGRLVISSEMRYPFLFGEKAEIDDHAHMGCAAGYDTLCIGPDGTVYPCPYLRDFPLGNVKINSIGAIWRKSRTLELLGDVKKEGLGEPCKSCRWAPSPCIGGCRAMAYYYAGDLMAADPTCVRDLIQGPSRMGTFSRR